MIWRVIFARIVVVVVVAIPVRIRAFWGHRIVCIAIAVGAISLVLVKLFLLE